MKTIVYQGMALMILIGALWLVSCKNIVTDKNLTMKDSNLTEEEWRKILSEEQYRVLRLKATERPFTGKYYKHNEKGVYCCAGCGAELFSSESKYDSGCGWPSFYDAIEEGRIITAIDTSYNMVRTEIMCASCKGHLGHLFDDGPLPTGKRYCVNSVSLTFKKK